MITKTIGLGSEYTDLYAEIKAASGDTIIVNSLEEFFMNITKIAALENGKFLRLPLDEPMFVIDANTRKISIPTDFSTNGLSVQGDHLAETIFFKIDRYFDFVDLNTKDIYINWKLGDQSGTSKNFIKSIDIEPGYIIFGWPVAKELTAKSGVLSFAVQICGKDASGALTYNFNTLASTIAIKDGLVLNAPIEVNVTNDILNMLTDSAYSMDDVPVSDITWVSGAGNGLVANGPSAEYAKEVNLPTTLDDKGNVGDKTVDLYALAKANEATVVYHPDADVNYELKGIQAEGAKIDGIIYYADAEGKAIASTEVIDAWFAENRPADAAPVYLRYCVLKADAARNYDIRANGVKYQADGSTLGVGETARSELVTVPAAKAPKVSLAIAAQAELGEGYAVDESANAVYLDATNGATLTASFGLGEDMDDDDKGAWKYVWSKKIGTSKNFESAKEAIYTKNESDDLAVAEEGEFKISLEHYKNGTTANSENEVSITASYLASPIATIALTSGVQEVGDNLFYNSGSSKASNRSVSVAVSATLGTGAENEKIYGDATKLSYVWERTNSVIPEEEGEEIVWEAVDEKNSASIVIKTEGYYRVKVINSYNGSSYSKYSKTFYVYDTASSV